MNFREKIFNSNGLKENADYVTLSNDEDGVAHVLELILKKGKENINVRKGL